MKVVGTVAASLALLATIGSGVAAADLGAPAAPAGVAAAGTSSGVKLRWHENLEPHVTSYAIERRSGAGAWAPLSSTWRTDYIDTSAVSGTAYSYRVTAGSISGATSTPSAAANVTGRTRHERADGQLDQQRGRLGRQRARSR